MTGEWLASFLATYFLHSTIFLLGAWVVLSITRLRSHSLCEWTWKSATLLPLLTSVLAIASMRLDLASLWKRSGVPERRAAQQELHVPVPSVQDPLPATRELHEPRTETANLEHVQESFGRAIALLHTAAAPEVSPSSWPYSVAAHLPVAVRWLSIGWSVWAITFCLWFVVRARQLAVRLGGHTIRTGKARRVLDSLIRRNNIKRSVTLTASPYVHEPAAYGLFRWTIVLPTGNLSSDDELKALLAHELGHLVRRDVAWLCFGRLVCGLFPFQPLNRLALARWRVASEFLADEWAVQAGADSPVLARCLVEVAESGFAQPLHRLAASAGGGRSPIVERVDQLLRGNPVTEPWAPWGRRAIVAAMTTVAAALVTVPISAAVAPANTRTTLAWTSLHYELDQLTKELAYADELANRRGLEEATLASLADIRGRAESLRERILSAVP